MEDFTKSFLLTIVKATAFCLAGFVVFYFSFNQYKNWEMYKVSQLPPFVDDGVCNVVTIPISGTIGIGATDAKANDTGATISSIPLTGDVDRVIHDLEYVKNYTGIDAVILQIDSYGGYGNADEVLLAYISKYPKPIVSLIRDAGASMGYSSSLGSKRIFAYPGATVGSIGVNMSYVNYSEKNKKDGLKYVSIVSGKYKDAGVPDKELSDEELAYLKDQNKKNFERFVDTVSKYRNMPKEKVEQLADGRVWYSDEAKDLGLIDEVGDKDAALKWIEKYWSENQTKVAIPCAQY